MTSRRVVVTGMGAVSAAGVGADLLWQAARDGKPCIGPLEVREPYGGRIRISAQVRDFDIAARVGPKFAPFCRRLHRLRPGRRRRGAGPGGARPRGAPGPPLRRPARRRHRRDEARSTTALHHLCRKQASGHAGRPASSFRAPGPAHTFHSLWRDRPLFRGRQRLFLGQPGDRHGRADDPRRHDRPRHRRRRGGLRHQWRDARLGRPARADARFLPAFRQEPQRHGAGRRRRHVRAGGRGHRPRARRQAAGGPRRLWHQQRRTRPGAARRGAQAPPAWTMALEDAGLSPADIDYVNAHGTATVANDANEAEGLNIAFGAHCEPSAGLLDQAGPRPRPRRGRRAGTGRFRSWPCANRSRRPISTPRSRIRNCRIRLVGRKAVETRIRAVLSNSLAFGGINASLIVTPYPSA